MLRLALPGVPASMRQSLFFRYNS